MSSPLPCASRSLISQVLLPSKAWVAVTKSQLSVFIVSTTPNTAFPIHQGCKNYVNLVIIITRFPAKDYQLNYDQPCNPLPANDGMAASEKRGYLGNIVDFLWNISVCFVSQSKLVIIAAKNMNSE